MSLKMNNYEYINENTIHDQLKCIICTKPFQSPVSVDCKHTFCISCIDTWMKQNSSCPICCHLFGTGHILTKVEPDILLNQLDCLLVRCLKCNKTDIKRVDFNTHYERCSKTRKTKTSNLFRKRWQIIKAMIRRKKHPQTIVITTAEIVGDSHESREILHCELPNVQYESYQQEQQPSNLCASTPRQSRFLTPVITGFFEQILLPFFVVFIACVGTVYLLPLLVVLLYLGIFWKVLIIIFLIWLGLKLWRKNQLTFYSIIFFLFILMIIFRRRC